MNKVLCFGELLLRLSPDDGWLQNNKLPAFTGGAEANVAGALALWGQPVGYCTVLPDNFLSKQLVTYLADKNIDTSPIHYSGSRIGLYYLQQGTDVKNSGVTYDREGSSFAQLQKGIINWEEVFDGVSWFHFSAIAASLTQNAADACEEALQYADAKGITISVDLNYRNKLWQYGKQADEIMPALVKFCDVVMGNIWSANVMLGIPLGEGIQQLTKEGYIEQAIQTSEAIQQQFPKVKTIANTFRFDANEGIEYYTTLFQQQLFLSALYQADTVLDKVGSGDCFMAGLIYGLTNNHQPQQVLDFATAAAFSKLFIQGDSTSYTVEEIKAKIKDA